MRTGTWIQNGLLCDPISKGLLGHKRCILEAGEASGNPEKRVKMRDLESIIRSEDEAGRRGIKITHPDAGSDSKPHLNVNITSFVHNDNAGAACPEGLNNCSSSWDEEIESFDSFTQSREFELDPNAKFVSFCPTKNFEDLKSGDYSECVRSVDPIDGKYFMRVWNGLKLNNFMSSSHETVPTHMPKPHRRKKNSNIDVMKKKKEVELAKKEQVDRFARIAAPSGLLNGLNPGIINHVRSSKQVHSIIKALVKSESRSENLSSGSKQGDQNHMSACALFSEPISNQKSFSRTLAKCNLRNESNGLALKLSSSVTAVSEYGSCLSNQEVRIFSSVASPPIEAANVASQWLELLSQDIRGRLAALRRSRTRVVAVITTELPFLISREFGSNPENATADAHTVRWSSLIEQMDKSLSEEEGHLESWLSQVKELQLNCERGLYKARSIRNDCRICIGFHFFLYFGFLCFWCRITFRGLNNEYDFVL